MHLRMFTRLMAAALLMLMLALSFHTAPAAQAAGSSSWTRLSNCTLYWLSPSGAKPLAESNTTLVVSSTGSSWTFYRTSDKNYAIELAGTGKFVTSSSRSGAAATVQAYNVQNPDTQLWTIVRSGTSYTFKNVATDMYFFTINNTVTQRLGDKSYFSPGASGTTCGGYYSY